ncbi:MAG: hypothetical protein SFT68_03455 [Rickettsiaceae bacterium]|nr:hypothetical protein [Rickettsiaceae bacterium]
MKLRNVLLNLVIGSIFGGSIVALYSYISPVMIIYHSKVDKKFGFEVIKSLISTSSELNDATVVMAAQSSTQFGKEFYNNITAEGRRSIIAHPYDKQGSGVSVTVTYFDSSADARKVMLMQKLAERNQPRKGLKNRYDKIGGYTKGAGVEGSKIEENDFIAEEARDAAEDAYVLSNEQLIIKKQGNGNLDSYPAKTEYLSKENFAMIDKAIDAYGKQQIAQDPYVASFNPEEVKSYLRDCGIKYTRDYNSIDTAIREFYEETGYNGVIKPHMIKELYVTDNYGFDNLANLHTKVSHFIIDLGALEKAPIIYQPDYNDIRVEGSFKANNTEIGKLLWVGIDELENDSDNQLLYKDIEIIASYIPTLNIIVRHLRNNELAEASKGTIVSHNHLVALARNLGLVGNLGEFNGEFGPKHHKIHKRDKCIAGNIGQILSFNQDSLSRIVSKCTEK